MGGRSLRAVIIGSGFAGLGAAIRLRQAGVDDLLLLERGDTLGGTWRDNTYPGAACDIPSHLYSYSFAPKADWSRRYAPQPEIRAYLQDVATRFGLWPHLRCHSTVVAARYDQGTATWDVEVADGTVHTADIVVSAIGALRDPAYPAIPGRDEFRGVQMHTSRWDHGTDLAGKRVGVIGTGASAIQVVPQLGAIAEHLSVFQRTPAWVVPRHDRAYSRLEQWLFRHLPATQRLHRAWIYALMEGRLPFFSRNERLVSIAEGLGRYHLRRQVDDPDLRHRLTPDYRMGCKRVLVSDDYYPTFNRPNVSLETDAILRVTPTGVAMADGRHVELDAIVWATGFAVDRPLDPIEVHGRDGVCLRERWEGDRPAAYLGVTVPDFPNLFFLLGPNTGLGHNSIIYMIESQIAYVVDAVRRLQHGDATALDVRPDRLDAFLAEVDTEFAGRVWASGCRSWYLDDQGRNFTLWPGTTFRYRRRTATFDLDDYREVGPDRVPVPTRHEPLPATAEVGR